MERCSKRHGWMAFSSIIAISVAGTFSPVLAEPKGQLTIGTEWDAVTMDPQMHRQRYTQIISHAMRDKLAYLPPPGQGQALLLAKGFNKIDDFTFEAVLHEGIKFHNGLELTADDVVYTYERLLSPETKSPRATMGNLGNIEAVTKVDTYTVRWKTKAPILAIEDAIQGLHLVGQELLQKETSSKLSLDESRTAAPIGVGPFKFVEWVPQQRVVMEAFDDYWQGAPGVKTLIWRTIPEETMRISELLAGGVDMIYPVSPDFIPQLKVGGMKLEMVPGTTTMVLQINIREDSPFHDIELRRALNQAIDKTIITEHLYHGTATPVGQVAGVGQMGHIEGYEPFPFDADAAGAVLSKVTKPIELFVQPRWELPAEAIAEQLRGYGMKVTTTIMDNAAFAAISDEGRFDLALTPASYASGNFVGSFYDNHFDCGRLDQGRVRTGICVPGLDEATQKILGGTLDAEQSKEVLEGVVRELTEVHIPRVPLFVESEVWAMHPHVEGFVGSSTGQFFDLHKVSLSSN